MDTVPIHIGLILDGNRRWAKAKGLPTIEGHRKGYETLRIILKDAFNEGVQYISAYVFSTENWNRSEDETSYLMKLARYVLKHEVKELHKGNIKIVWMGSKEGLPDKIVDELLKAEELTKNNTRGTFVPCFNYGGQQELADAFNSLSKSKHSEVQPEDIENALYHPEVPPVDLLIRTSGEQRLSGYMLWRAAYAELHFVDKFWPDFTIDDFRSAISTYVSRHRRFGK